jgi:hypothetical protein
MEKLKSLKEKKEWEKKESISFSLPLGMIRELKKSAEKYGLNHSDIVEQALSEFFPLLGAENDLESYAESQQEAYQTGVIVP